MKEEIKISDVIKARCKTQDGYCCACGYDMAVFKGKILEAQEQNRKEIENWAEENKKQKSKLTTHEQTWYFIDGYNQALEDLKNQIKK